MAKWLEFSLETLYPEGMDELVSFMSATAEKLNDLLSTTAEIIRISGNLVKGVVDVEGELLQGLLDSVQNQIDDLTSAGFYIIWHMPTTPLNTRKFYEFLDDLADSFDDNDDKQRPQFSEDAYMGALVLAAAFPTYTELADWVESFVNLMLDVNVSLSRKTFIDPDGLDAKSIDDYFDADSAQSGKKPDWTRGGIIDINKSFGEMLILLSNFIESFKGIESTQEIADTYADFIIAKAENMQILANRLEVLLNSMTLAFGQTGIYALPILGQGGNKMVQSALRNRSGDPSTIKTSSQRSSSKAIQALTDTYAEVSELPSGSSSFPAGEPREETLNAKLDAEQSLKDLENQIANNSTNRYGNSLNVSKAITNAINDEEVSFDVLTDKSYDDNGNPTSNYKDQKAGLNFEPTEAPDFVNLEHFAAGLMILTGGPSPEPANALLNLFGITGALAKAAEVGILNIGEQGGYITSITSGENNE